VETDSGFVRAWIGIAEASSLLALFFTGGDESRSTAKEAADTALQLAPNNSGSYVARAYAHLANERFSDAEADFLKAIDLDPLQVRAYHYLGRAAQHQGHTQRALKYFDKSVEMDPDDYESALLILSNYHKMDDPEGARRSARIGVERAQRHMADYPNNPRPYYLGAAGLITLGETEQALEWAQRAEALAPDDSATRYNLACIYALLGEPEKALDSLENSITSSSWIENDPELDSLRDHPRYKAIIESLKVQE
jgi:adenylate cyclase